MTTARKAADRATPVKHTKVPKPLTIEDRVGILERTNADLLMLLHHHGIRLPADEEEDSHDAPQPQTTAV
jgi:hypothetical protein